MEEREIGETFEFAGDKFKIKIGGGCRECAFVHEDGMDGCDFTGKCMSLERRDRCSVVAVKISE